MKLAQDFWRDRRVLLTGHTGFKGAWMAVLLRELGAHTTGVALEPITRPSLFEILGPWDGIDSHIVDIRDAEALGDVIKQGAPDIVIHMAAQALVRHAYREPVETFETNVQGTVNVLEALRVQPGLSGILVVTSDKVYRNDESGRSFGELDPLGGDDPYSASKAATEMATRAWAKSYFDDANVPVITARAGNVIGGGDFSADRIVPDTWRAKQAGSDIVLRYPNATRPWQHVLDLNVGYLAYIEAVVNNGGQTVPRSLNLGPVTDEELTVETIARTMMGALGATGQIRVEPTTLKEKTSLGIDTGLAQESIGWSPVLGMRGTLDWTAEWYKRFGAGEDPRALTNEQVGRHLELLH